MALLSRFIISSALLIPIFFQGCKPATRIEGLKTEHLENPLGIDNPAPRLSWRMEDSREGAVQTSYRVVVGKDKRAVEDGKGDVWDSGTIGSDACLVTYGGMPLEPFTEYWWKVFAGDRDGKVVSSKACSFEMATMGRWSPDGQWVDDGKDIDWKPAPYFRKEFTIGKKVKSARAYIASAGFNSLYVNGKKIGDRVLDPAFTTFDKHILYTVWDITPNLEEGVNAIGVILGNGWYNHQPKTSWDFNVAYWRNRPAFRMDVRITFEDGETVTIPTDTSWKAFSDGPLYYDNVFTGERYDARKEMEGWNRAGFDDTGWAAACFRESPTAALVAQAICPIRSSRDIKAVSVNRINDSCRIFDFGQNMSGNVTASIKGRAGVKVSLRYGERLFENGLLDQTNINHLLAEDRTLVPFQTDSLILGENGVCFSPEFSYKGFRYVQVNSSEPIELDADCLMAHFEHSDVPDAGNVRSSNELIEKLENAARASYLSNLMGYPTDCPQREKNGWTGDAHIAIETGLYNFDAFTVYEKWMQDHRDVQLSNGVLPDIVPTAGWGYGRPEDEYLGSNGLDWTSTIALIPWELYLFYGDIKPLADCYDSIKKYVDFATTHTENLLSYWGRGDWVPVTKKSNPWLIHSSFHYIDCKILSRTAELLGKEEDARYYAGIAEITRNAINDRFLDPETGIYADGMQTSQALPLCFGVVPDEARAKVAARLAETVHADGYHIDAGVHGAKAVPNALAMNGYIDEAYRMAVQDTYPSWGWWIKNGHTTFIENWVLGTSVYSDNHIMFGDIAAWFYRWIGGIQPDPEMPGFKRVVLKPGFPEGLDSFSCHHDSPYGRIISGWTRSGDGISYKVTIPANSTGLLWLPGEEKPVEVSSGHHEFKIKS
ncbi:MAG: glycoside hydrolase family 78 protein [Bacteroidales bacterium]|nr:glycoside hydrolase family 78 protein [Bacteroidales bacterium]